jgi:hypothetical protein
MTVLISFPKGIAALVRGEAVKQPITAGGDQVLGLCRPALVEMLPLMVNSQDVPTRL